MNIHRIRTEYDLDCVVALDNFDLIAERVQGLLSHGRTLMVAHQYATYIHRAPDLFSRQTVNNVQVRTKDREASLWIACTDIGIGFHAYAWDGNETEAQVWQRYHKGQHEAGNPFDRRRNLVDLQIQGGREGDPAGRSDRLVVRAYNQDGVCDEKVIAFEAVA